MVLALIVLFLMNRNYLDNLKERREIIQLILTERTEWLKNHDQIENRLWETLKETVESNLKVANELNRLATATQQNAPGSGTRRDE